MISEKVVLEMRTDLFRSILSKDVEFFDSRKTGELLSRLGSDVSVI